MDNLLATIYDGFLESDTFPYNIYIYFDKIDNVLCNARFDMRSDNMITFKIYSKNVYCTYDDNDPILLYDKKYLVSEKELNEKKLDKNKIQKYSKDLLEELPKLRLSTMGTLKVKEEADIIDQMNELFVGMPNVTYSVDKCHKCKNNTKTKTPCCKAHLCYRCWFDNVECPTCERDISYV
jgi:hypothetical protein